MAVNTKPQSKRVDYYTAPPSVLLSVIVTVCVIIGSGLPLAIVLLTKH